MIWQELDSSLIMTDLEVRSQSEIMDVLGNAFVARGYCRDTYVEALKAREKEFPTGLNIQGTGVAIPHTDASHVCRHGIGIAVLKESVPFIQMATDDEQVDVKLVFMLAVKDPDAHLEKIQAVLRVIQDQKVLKQLIKAGGTEEIIEIIRKKES